MFCYTKLRFPVVTYVEKINKNSFATKRLPIVQ